jgi:hypothetical protein
VVTAAVTADQSVISKALPGLPARTVCFGGRQLRAPWIHSPSCFHSRRSDRHQFPREPARPEQGRRSNRCQPDSLAMLASIDSKSLENWWEGTCADRFKSSRRLRSNRLTTMNGSLALRYTPENTSLCRANACLGSVDSLAIEHQTRSAASPQERRQDDPSAAPICAAHREMSPIDSSIDLSPCLISQ